MSRQVSRQFPELMLRPISRAVLEPLELRRLLSAALADPIAVPLLATPADGSLSSGSSTPPSSAFTPAEIASAYGINSIKLNGVVGNGAGQTIAIVTADDDPALVSSTASNFSTSDLAIFDQEYGLPNPTFTKIEQTIGKQAPPANTGWSEEASLDVEWTHAIAPDASIDLIEANSATAIQLLNYGVVTAAEQPGVSVVTMSFGFSEFSGETSYDADFKTPSGHSNVTFIASTGDTSAPGYYPSFSPNVVAVGGTTLSASNGNYSSETGYDSSGGGISQYEAKPSYQSSVTQSSSLRTTPDVSFDGDPNTGVAVYDSYNGGYPGWYKIAGTSFSAPAWAGLVAIANQGRAGAGMSPLDGPSQTLPNLYSISSSDYHDITSGNNGFAAGAGYDLVTGRGTPIANLLVPALAGVSTTSTTGSIAGTVSKVVSGTTSSFSGVTITLKNTSTLDITTSSSSSGTYSFTGLPAGTYYVSESVPLDYTQTAPNSSTITVTLGTGQNATGENFIDTADSTTATTGSIAGTVSKVVSGSTSDFSGVTITLKNTSTLDITTSTSSSGTFSFTGLPAGTYYVSESVPSGYTQTSPSGSIITVTLGTGQNASGESFTDTANSTTSTTVGSLAGTVYKVVSGVTTDFSGVTITLKNTGTLDITTPTSSSGTYSFARIPAGTYYLSETVPSGYTQTSPSTSTITVNLTSGENATGENFTDTANTTTAPTATPLSGTVIGTSGSFDNSGNTISKAFDGSLTTFFDGPTADGNWAGLNLGSTYDITSIKYSPRSGWASRMVGGIFQGSNSATFASGVTNLATISSTPTVGSFTTISISNSTALQYVRYLSPSGSYGDVAEVQFFGTAAKSTATKLSGTVIGTSGSFDNSGNTINNAFDGNLTTFFDGPTANGNWAGLNLGSAQTIGQISYAPRAGWTNRMVGGIFQASNSATFSTSVVNLYTITAAPAYNMLTTVSVSVSGTYQYVRYLSPSGSYGDIAEMDFYS